ncbi:MAG: hypothetical protein M1300_08850 [Epsilonproteobacteria bacterium]|nr:hypothetical protein [Campylobacterota bacterium]
MFNANDYSNEELIRAEITATAGREISESEMEQLVKIGIEEIEVHGANTAEASRAALNKTKSPILADINENAINAVTLLLNHVDEGSDLHRGLQDVLGMISREPVAYGKHDFMEFFRSDRFHEEMSPEDCKEIFSQALHGSSDFSKELLDQTLGDYELGVLSLYSNEDLLQELKERGINVLPLKSKVESEINNYPPVEEHLTSFYKTGFNGISTRAYNAVDEIDLSDKYLFTMKSDFSNSLVDRLVNVYQNDPKIHINKTLQLHFEDSAMAAGRKFEVVNKTLAEAVGEIQKMNLKNPTQQLG